MTPVHHLLIKYHTYPKPGASELVCKEVDVFGFVGHTISVLTTPLGHARESSCRQHANKWMWPCFNKTLFMKAEGRPDSAQGLRLAKLCHKRAQRGWLLPPRNLKKRPLPLTYPWEGQLVCMFKNLRINCVQMQKKTNMYSASTAENSPCILIHIWGRHCDPRRRGNWGTQRLSHSWGSGPRIWNWLWAATSDRS